MDRGIVFHSKITSFSVQPGALSRENTQWVFVQLNGFHRHWLLFLSESYGYIFCTFSPSLTMTLQSRRVLHLVSCRDSNSRRPVLKAHFLCSVSGVANGSSSFAESSPFCGKVTFHVGSAGRRGAWLSEQETVYMLHTLEPLSVCEKVQAGWSRRVTQGHCSMW